MATSQYRRYFVRSGDILTDHIVQSATHAVRAFFRRIKKAGRVHELGELIGISRRGFEDKEMLYSLAKNYLYVNQKTGLVLLPSTIAEMPIEVPEPPAHDFDLRKELRGPRKPPKDGAAKWRHKCVAEGRCPRCGDRHGGRLVLCETCREKMKSYREPKRKRHAMESPAAPISVPTKSLQTFPAGDFVPTTKVQAPTWLPVANGWYYDPSSGSREECERRIEDQEARQSGTPTPAEIKARAAGVRSRRVDDEGHPLAHLATSLGGMR